MTLVRQSMFSVLGLGLAVFMLVGCGGTTRIDLEYKPAFAVESGQSGTVAVVEFKDIREVDQPRQIGQLRNAVGARSGKLLSDNITPAAWISSGFASELKHAGYTVKEVDEEDKPGKGIEATGEVQYLNSDMKGNSVVTWFSTLIKVRVVVTNNGKVVLDKMYQVQSREGSTGINKKELRAEYTKLLKGLLKKAMPDIVDTI